MILFNSGAATASEHHSGHGGGKGGAVAVLQVPVATTTWQIFASHLATIAPEGTFTFLVFNIDKPEQVAVTVKNIPVEVTAEFKDPYYLFTGKMPASLVNTAARINVKVSANPRIARLKRAGC